MKQQSDKEVKGLVVSQTQQRKLGLPFISTYILQVCEMQVQ